MDFVVLVDTNDNELGTEEKLAAHHRGLLHRAFSIFIVTSQGNILLQRRAQTKYHSRGLWTNACCSHPRPGESLQDATQRRLLEELGIQCPLTHLGHFIYQAPLEDGLIEHELDHVFVGTYDAAVSPNPEEADAIRYLSPQEVKRELQQAPLTFTAWFEKALSFISQ